MKLQSLESLVCDFFQHYMFEVHLHNGIYHNLIPYWYLIFFHYIGTSHLLIHPIANEWFPCLAMMTIFLYMFVSSVPLYSMLHFDLWWESITLPFVLVGYKLTLLD